MPDVSPREIEPVYKTTFVPASASTGFVSADVPSSIAVVIFTAHFEAQKGRFQCGKSCIAFAPYKNMFARHNATPNQNTSVNQGARDQ
jgi:hypothetical protein